MSAQLHLRIIHALPTRVRLQWAVDLEPRTLDQLHEQLALQSWLHSYKIRRRSRSLVLELMPACPTVRWQLAMAALGWQLQGPEAAAAPKSAASSPWYHLSRQLGGNLIGAALGQAMLGGGAAAVGAALSGPGLALALGGIGSVVGAVIGSVIGSTVADGHADAVPSTLGSMSWRKFSLRMGEEAGSRSGMALGSALGGPVGAVAGFAVGSMIGGQLGSDLSGPAAQRRSIGQRSWLVGMVRDTTGESISEGLGASLGASLGGGSEAARQLGGSMGLQFARQIDWNASLHHHRLVPGQTSAAKQASVDQQQSAGNG